MVTAESSPVAMSTAGYVQEGKQQRRHRAAFGCLVFLALLLFVLITAAASALGWYLLKQRDQNVHITIFHDEPSETLGTDTSDPVHDEYPVIKEPIDEPDINPVKPREYDVTLASTSHADDVTESTTYVRTTSLPTTKSSTHSNNDNHVTNDELSDVMQKLWDASLERYLEVGRDFALHFQGITNKTDTVDRAPKKLFQKMSNKMRKYSAIHRKFVRLLDNFNDAYGEEEEYNLRKVNEEKHFLEAFSSTETYRELERFIASKYTDAMKDNLSTMLHTLWFQPVHKSKTTAFELIFVGEKRESQVFGLNNWMQFYFQEKEKRIDYHGYIHKNQIGLLEVRFTWDGLMKTSSTFFVGTSPDFELAMYTLCYMVHPYDICSFTLGGHTISISSIQTLDNHETLEFKLYSV